MAKVSSNDALQLLRLISEMGSKGSAEWEPQEKFLLRYLPLPEHARALDPDVILVVGDRGAGKTELFRAVQFPEGREAIQKVGASKTLPSSAAAEWLVGYAGSGPQHPSPLIFRQFSIDKQPPDIQLIWLGLLLKALLQQHLLAVAGMATRFIETLESQPLALQSLFEAVRQQLETSLGVLDRTDAQLQEKGKWAFVTYDELDRISAADWEQLRVILRGLIQFWATHARRWQRIRPKIFLRKDLFDRVALFGPDVSKIAGHRVELVWSTRNLYALCAKRMINHDALLCLYFRPVMPEGEDRGPLGWLPTAGDEENFRGMIERLCGKYMGAEPRKGKAFPWIVNHLQDANRRVLPRSIVKFFESAAEVELANRRAEWPRLLHHTSMRLALDRVSESRVQEIEDEEFPWIRTVRSQLQRVHPQVPIERREMEQLLRLDWSSAPEKPPETSGHGLLQLLMELGIFYLRADGADARVDVRDLYLKGFGLKRKGGVARPY